MGASGQGPSEQKIIDDPKLLSPLRRWMERFVTVGLWTLWVYWIIPVFTAFLWYFGFKVFAQRLFDKQIFSDLLNILRGGWIIIAIVLLANLSWIYYNYQFIYKKKGKGRHFGEECLDDKLAERFHVNKQQMLSARAHPRLAVNIKDSGLDIEYYCNICTDAGQAFSHIEQGKCKYERCFYKINKQSSGG